MTTRNILGIICLLVLCGILLAGLWPFHAPANEVSWLNHSNGLSFGKYGSIVSAGMFKADPQKTDSSCSFEIWLQPKRVDNSDLGIILAFYRPENGIVPFFIRQYHDGLVLQRTTQNNAKKSVIAVYADHIFSRDKPVLVTITANQTGTTIYADGEFRREFADLGFSSKDLTGRLVVANSPLVTYSWSGQVRGLAIYSHELTTDEASKHLTGWTKSGRPDNAGDGAGALYLFNEGKGNVVHNQVDSTTDLVVPERFFVLHEQFLEWPWDEYRPDWRYWKNVGINIVGFIPLGFFFSGYFSLFRKIKGPGAKTIALGFAISLTIEVLQAFLPTRDSGVTDLITNTLGTAIGVIAFKMRSRRGLQLAPPSQFAVECE